jgi:hypothetical protein
MAQNPILLYHKGKKEKVELGRMANGGNQINLELNR